VSSMNTNNIKVKNWSVTVVVVHIVPPQFVPLTGNDLVGRTCARSTWKQTVDRLIDDTEQVVLRLSHSDSRSAQSEWCERRNFSLLYFLRWLNWSLVVSVCVNNDLFMFVPHSLLQLFGCYGTVLTLLCVYDAVIAIWDSLIVTRSEFGILGNEGLSTLNESTVTNI
jgi:hypothetical protein